jgi:hypothetical protein
VDTSKLPVVSEEQKLDENNEEERYIAP